MTRSLSYLISSRPGDHVLDLCCAPGAKLAMIADLLQLRGSVTGVDCSRQRLGACKQLVYKYQLVQTSLSQSSETTTSATSDTHHVQDDTTQPLSDPRSPSPSWRCRLFHADGRSFAVGPTTELESLLNKDIEVVLDTEEIAARGVRGQQRKRVNKSARARASRKQRKLSPATSSSLRGDTDSADTAGQETTARDGYDKVLVDAECTHDGSVRHLQKHTSLAKWTHYVENHLTARELERILRLQHDLIRCVLRLRVYDSGWRHLMDCRQERLPSGSRRRRAGLQHVQSFCEAERRDCRRVSERRAASQARADRSRRHPVRGTVLYCTCVEEELSPRRLWD